MSKYLALRQTSVLEEIYSAQNEADAARKAEYQAAVRIQAWWRGAQLRRYIVFLNKSARKIQSAYRGHLGRLHFQVIVKAALEKMKNDFYNKMATRIQARWRGYFTRKYKHNYYARKNYLEAVSKRNIEVRDALSQYVEAHEEEKQRENRRLEEQEKILQARRLHYMRSTYQINGVFASPWFPQNDFEKLLASVKPLTIQERQKLFPNKKQQNQNDPQKLPPIKNAPQKRVQGPFRSPQSVHNQRYRALSPSLRVLTPFDSEEQQKRTERDKEWTRRIQNKPMSFPQRRSLRDVYEPLLHTTSKYGDIPYGTKYFREESQDAARFNSVVPPIPVFDKFGKTFGKGTVY